MGVVSRGRGWFGAVTSHVGFWHRECAGVAFGQARWVSLAVAVVVGVRLERTRCWAICKDLLGLVGEESVR